MYIEYHELFKKYKDAEKDYYDVLDRYARLWNSVTPQATQFKEIVNNIHNTSPDTKLIRFANDFELLDKMVSTTKNIRDMLKYELEKKEIELKNSNNAKDKIYYYKWIKRVSPYKFSRIIGYSVRQSYNIIAEIKINLYKN
jgi:hypothetical protein